jgi:hypothetical protein
VQGVQGCGCGWRYGACCIPGWDRVGSCACGEGRGSAPAFCPRALLPPFFAGFFYGTGGTLLELLLFQEEQGSVPDIVGFGCIPLKLRPDDFLCAGVFFARLELAKPPPTTSTCRCSQQLAEPGTARVGPSRRPGWEVVLRRCNG